MSEMTPIDKQSINTIRILSIDAVQKAKSGHPGAPMGMAPAMYVLWDRFLRHDPADPGFPNRDRFVLSMGHASMLLYSTLHLTGYDVSLDDIKNFRQLHGKCPGHPECKLLPGVETTTGPLGQGVGNSVGMAVAQRWLASFFNTDQHTLIDYSVYAMCSDGDLMEGLGSEVASLAGHLGLSNLIWIYDSNRITIDGDTALTFSENVVPRFQAYGWFVQQVRDANNLDEIHAAYDAAKAEPNRPSLVIVDSQIGYGSPNRAGTAQAHGEPMGEDEIRLIKQGFGFDPDQHFFVPDEVRTHMQDRAARRGAALSADWLHEFKQYAVANPQRAKQWHQMRDAQLPDAWNTDLPKFDPDPQGIATRVASAKALAVVAAKVPWMLGGSADLVTSTKTRVKDAGLFQKDHHGGRNIAFGVREHAMVSVMNGLALSGIRPFGSSFLTFTDYCRPSIRLAALGGIPCIFLFTHDSIGLGEDGPTHQPIEHLASLRAMPNLDVIRPCDANEASVAWEYIMPINDRPVLLALTRQNVPTLDRSRFASANGLLQGAYVLADCDGSPELILIGTGSEVHLCVQAWETLTAEGIKARVVSMPCWEAFDRQPEEYRTAVLPPDVTMRISVEAGATMGWAKYVGPKGISIGIDRFGLSAPYAEVMREFGFTAKNIVQKAHRLLGRTDQTPKKPNPAPTIAAAQVTQPPSKKPAPPAKENPMTSPTSAIRKIAELGQSIWCDQISRTMIDSGDLTRLIDDGIVGVTTNPTIFQKAVATGKAYDDRIQTLVAAGTTTEEAYEAITVPDVADAADMLRPVYERTDGLDGFVSLEVNPHLADDTAGTVAEGRRFFTRLHRPNIFIKVPATEAGMPAITTLISEGINVNVTLIFSLEMYAKVMAAYIEGLDQLAASGGDVGKVASVASFFVSRVDTLTDKRLQEKIDAGNTDLKRLFSRAAIANAKLAYQQYKEVFHGRPFAALAAKGARPQRPLWASTSVKNPSLPETYYVDALIGPQTVNTMPLQTIEAVKKIDHPVSAIETDLDRFRADLAAIESAGILMNDVTAELLKAGVQSFADSFDGLLNDIRDKMALLQTA